MMTFRFSAFLRVKAKVGGGSPSPDFWVWPGRSERLSSRVVQSGGRIGTEEL